MRQEFPGSSFTERPREMQEFFKVTHYILLDLEGELSFPASNFCIYSYGLFCKLGVGLG
jgi:hypothetical protein